MHKSIAGFEVFFFKFWLNLSRAKIGTCKMNEITGCVGGERVRKCKAKERAKDRRREREIEKKRVKRRD